MAAPYVLAHTLSDAHRFAQETLGLARGYYRVVTSPSTIKGPIGADLHLVPGWERRFDRFSMKGAIRWTRLNVVDHTKEPVEAPAPDPRGDLTDRQIEVAYRYNALLAEPDGLEPRGEQLTIDGADTTPAEPQPEETPAEAPDKRRRRRCKECGVLVDPDDVETHAAEHLPTEV